MFKFIKQNLLIAIISGSFGCVITLFAIFALHVKTWDSDTWSAAFNFFVAIGTIGAVWVALYLSNKRPDPYDYIQLDNVTLRLYKLCGMNYVDVAYQITNLTDFKIKISRVSIQTKQFKLFDNFNLDPTNDNDWDKLKARKTFYGKSSLGRLNDDLQFEIDLPEIVITELQASKPRYITVHLDSDLFSYKLTPKKIMYNEEAIQHFGTDKLITLTF